MTDLQERLFALQDKKYAAFHASLVPTIAPETIIGVRMPDQRKLAKVFGKEEAHTAFLKQLPHTYYEENMQHALLINACRSYEECLKELEAFLPYIDNWAVCDGLSPKVFGKHHAELILEIRRWAADAHEYTCRFGIEMLMSHYLDEDFKEEYLEIPAAIRREEYYVKMMVAWFFATALAKQWDASIRYIEEKRLDVWTHNKSIQKAIESYRITPEQKNYLRTLKLKGK